jgi:hypothetical protein
VIATMRRELRKLSPDVRIDADQIREALAQEVLKREVLEGEKAEEARRKVARLAARAARASEERGQASPLPNEPAPEAAQNERSAASAPAEITASQLPV